MANPIDRSNKLEAFSLGLLLLGGAIVAPFFIRTYAEKDSVRHIDPAVLDLAKKIISRDFNMALAGDIPVKLASGENIVIRYLAEVQYGSVLTTLSDRRSNYDRILIQNSIQDIFGKSLIQDLDKDPSEIRLKVMKNLPDSIINLNLYRRETTRKAIPF